MLAVAGYNGKKSSGNGWQRSRAAFARREQGNKQDNIQGNAVMHHTLDIAGSLAR